MIKPKLLEQVRAVARLRHLSIHTENSYTTWIKRYIVFHQKRHPAEMGVAEIREFLTHLAVHERVAASTQNVALCALLFLYREVLQQDLPLVENIVRAKQPVRLPAVFSRAEVEAILAQLTGTYKLIASLLYGSGLRLIEAVRLRVKDLDFTYHQIIVREGKGEKDRRTMLPRPLVEPLQHQLAQAKLWHEGDLREGYGAVYLPYALDRKYPNAAKEWGWQYVFPSPRRALDPRSGIIRR